MIVSIRVNNELVEVDCEPDTTVEIAVAGRPVLGIVQTYDGVSFGHWPDGEEWESLAGVVGDIR